MKTYTFNFDGAEFQVDADSQLDAFGVATKHVRLFGVTDSFAWFESGPDTYTLHHDVLMD
jgi:hypothetical protein